MIMVFMTEAGVTANAGRIHYLIHVCMVFMCPEEVCLEHVCLQMDFYD